MRPNPRGLLVFEGEGSSPSPWLARLSWLCWGCLVPFGVMASVFVLFLLPPLQGTVERLEALEKKAAANREADARHQRLIDAGRKQQIRNAVELLSLQEDALKAGRELVKMQRGE